MTVRRARTRVSRERWPLMGCCWCAAARACAGRRTSEADLLCVFLVHKSSRKATRCRRAVRRNYKLLSFVSENSFEELANCAALPWASIADACTMRSCGAHVLAALLVLWGLASGHPGPAASHALSHDSNLAGPALPHQGLSNASLLPLPSNEAALAAVNGVAAAALRAVGWRRGVAFARLGARAACWSGSRHGSSAGWLLCTAWLPSMRCCLSCLWCGAVRRHLATSCTCRAFRDYPERCADSS